MFYFGCEVKLDIYNWINILISKKLKASREEYNINPITVLLDFDFWLSGKESGLIK